MSATNKVRTKVERFLSLLINIGDHPKDIYDAFDSYFKDEYLTMEEYGDVIRTVAVTTFPTILQVQIQRVYYDRERLMPVSYTHLDVYKRQPQYHPKNMQYKLKDWRDVLDDGSNIMS